MTVIDRPSQIRRPGASHRPVPPAPLGGQYVTSSIARPAMEGTYVTRTASASSTASSGGTRRITRGTYVTTGTPSIQHGGRYTYSS